MKKIALIIFCLLGTLSESQACSPVYTPFNEWLNEYNKRTYIIVEGYFQSEAHSQTSKFKVIRSSDFSIKIGQVYDVFEYGPFGSMCEMYEIASSIEPQNVGKENPRLLILYKNRSINGKLVNPIFLDAGIDALNNKISLKDYDYSSKEDILYECTTPLEEIWKQILKESVILEWKEVKYN